jgi:hypothetical protein
LKDRAADARAMGSASVLSFCWISAAFMLATPSSEGYFSLCLMTERRMKRKRRLQATAVCRGTTAFGSSSGKVSVAARTRRNAISGSGWFRSGADCAWIFSSCFASKDGSEIITPEGNTPTGAVRRIRRG